MAAVVLQEKPSFASGEIRPGLYDRFDFNRYVTGLAKCLNAVVRPIGGTTRRPPTELVKEALAASVLIPFELARDDTRIIEAGDIKARFFRDGGVVEQSPGVEYQVTLPYEAADLPDLRAAHSGDVVYLFHPARANVQKLSRFGDLDWRLSAANFQKGPFLDENTDAAMTIQASAASGTGITLTATGFTFDAGHIGAQFKLREKDLSSPGKWAGNVAVTVGDKVRSNGRIYQAADTKNTGPNPPDHTEGSELSGPGFVTWDYVRDEFGVAGITAVAGGGATATADVISVLPDDAVSAATDKWSEGAFSTLRGFPTTGIFHQQRLMLGKDTFVYGSASFNFEDMELNGEPAKAFVERIGSGTQRANKVSWISSGKILAIGTAGEEFSMSASSLKEAITATNLKIDPATTEGSIDADPVRVGDDVLHISADGRRLQRNFYDFQIDSFRSDDVSIQSRHLTASGIKKVAFQRDPLRVIWCLRNDGRLAGFTYDRNNELLAWHDHDLGGIVEDIAIIRSSDGAYDELWLIVRRTIGGTERRLIERMLRYFDPDVDTSPVAVAYLDCQIRQTFGSKVSVVSGLDIFDGSKVDVVADGSYYKQLDVVGGEITLASPASDVTVGLPQRQHLKLLPTVKEFGDGPTPGRQRHVNGMVLRFTGGPGTLIGDLDNFDNMEAVLGWNREINVPPALVSDQKTLHVDTGWSHEDFTDIVTDGPFAFEMLGAHRIVEMAGR